MPRLVIWKEHPNCPPFQRPAPRLRTGRFVCLSLPHITGCFDATLPLIIISLEPCCSRVFESLTTDGSGRSAWLTIRQAPRAPALHFSCFELQGAYHGTNQNHPAPKFQLGQVVLEVYTVPSRSVPSLAIINHHPHGPAQSEREENPRDIEHNPSPVVRGWTRRSLSPTLLRFLDGLVDDRWTL